ncbi:hypothetical protein SCLCIDRAFT_1208413 [Scleroderma citrinum Foug A]|uniref:Uncharacterized protein n=1 Tax=Scleroderma citrinum Foug A TaxID=1036808 RepID=A0A0C3EM47_9AGAM|nr:hypothetical protein SCLCIDRAFT_1208413 [Scleroderma citrinum Foug A]
MPKGYTTSDLTMLGRWRPKGGRSPQNLTNGVRRLTDSQPVARHPIRECTSSHAQLGVRSIVPANAALSELSRLLIATVYSADSSDPTSVHSMATSGGIE